MSLTKTYPAYQTNPGITWHLPRCENEETSEIKSFIQLIFMLLWDLLLYKKEPGSTGFLTSFHFVLVVGSVNVYISSRKIWNLMQEK